MAEALSGRRKATGGVAENDKVYQRPEGAPIEFFQPRPGADGAGTEAGGAGGGRLDGTPWRGSLSSVLWMMLCGIICFFHSVTGRRRRP